MSARFSPLVRRMISLVLIVGILTAFLPAQPARAETIINSNIKENTTWSGVYRVTSPITLISGVRLVILPGTIISFDTNAGIDCYGQMLALGDVNNPVVFTQTTGPWNGLKFLADDPQYGPSELWGSIIEFGGKGGANVGIEHANLIIANSKIRASQGDGVAGSVSGNAIITNTLFTGNAGYALRFNDSDVEPKLARLSAASNGHDAIALSGGGLSMNLGNRLWENAGLPYEILSNIFYNSNETLTIEPGVIVRFDHNIGLNISGRLMASGTAEKPITFTGIQQIPGFWSGIKITGANSQASAIISHASIEYGGTESVNFHHANVIISNSEISDGGGDGLVGSTNGNAVITNTLFTRNAGYALRFDDSAVDPKLANLSAANNGHDAIALGGGGSNINLGNCLWENAGLPYEVLSNIFLNSNETLTIEPATIVRFDHNIGLNIHGRLIAVGTAEKPITFTGEQKIPGFWSGISIYGASTPALAVLSHATIEYGGIGANLSVQSAHAIVDSTTIQNSAGYGVEVFSGGVAKIAHSQISENALGGAKNSRTDIQVSALNNWWGAASGPLHPTTNPGGLGNSVSDNVLYAPWLTDPSRAGPAASHPSALTVEVIGRAIYVPGSRQTYALVYRNGSPATITNAVLLAYVPDGAYFQRSEGGIYWPGREQVFWKLGDLAPGAEGVVAFSVEYAWGIPIGAVDGVTAAIAGTNAPDDLIAINDYLTYTSPILTRTPLSQAQANLRLAGSPQATVLYNQAMAEGFRFVEAFENSRSDGKGFGEVDLFKVGPPLTYQSIYIHATNATAQIFNSSGYTLRTGGSQLFYDPQRQDWVDQSALLDGSAPNQPASDFSKCMSNCAKEIANSKIFGKIILGSEAAEDLANCVEAAKNAGNDNAVLSCAKTIGSKIPIIGDAVDYGTELGKCNADCTADPTSHVCTSDQTECNSGFSALFYPAVVTRKCDTATGMYYAATDTICGAPGVSKCVVGADGNATCKNCYADSPAFSPDPQVKIPEYQIPSSGVVWDEFVPKEMPEAAPEAAPEVFPQAPSAAGSQQTFCPACAAAQDPNAKLGLEGMVAPGQRLAYTIQYENVGAGQAFGVFVMDTLSPVFDETSLVLGAGGRYLPGSRTILWDVGELASQGLAGSKGEITYTVKLRLNLTAGTVVVNQATVYFPSVPEITPTNAVVNLVQPIVGKDQQVNTTYSHVVSFQVSGVSAAPGALTYEISQQTIYGTLSGTLPNLTYTPMAGFSGSDTFYFTVSNGLETSLPAQVRINVQANKLFIPMVRR